ncbi:hypothetical protein T310_10168, partial [Rasamsonia emersonii CBS 393.64]
RFSWSPQLSNALQSSRNSVEPDVRREVYLSLQQQAGQIDGNQSVQVQTTFPPDQQGSDPHPQLRSMSSGHTWHDLPHPTNSIVACYRGEWQMNAPHSPSQPSSPTRQESEDPHTLGINIRETSDILGNGHAEAQY